jgi:hypothetical protein
MKFTFETMPSTVINSAPWSDRMLTNEGCTTKWISTKILSVAVREDFEFTVCDKLYVFSKELACFFPWFLSFQHFMFISPQIINRGFGLNRYFKAASRLLTNS